MLKNRYTKKIFAATLFTMVVPFAFASFTLTATVGEKSKSSKYSLKNLSHYSNKSLSLSLLRTSLQYKGLSSINQLKMNDGVGLNSFIQIDRGNTTYILPYSFKVKAPKFKTPSHNN